MKAGTAEKIPLKASFIQAVLERWGLKGDPLQIEDLGGSYNRNWRVQLSAADVVVRVRPPWVSEQRIRDIHALQTLLNQRQIATPRLRLSVNASTYEFIKGRLVEVYDYLPESEWRHWSTERWDSSFAHMGRLHHELNHLPLEITPPSVSNYAPPPQLRLMLKMTLEKLEELPPSPEQKEGLAICREAERVRLIIDIQLEPLRPTLPHHLVHGDYHLDNLLFNTRENVVYTLDFDFTAWRERIFELAYALRLALPQLTAKGECQLDCQLVKQWLESYDQNTPTPLTPTERAALPYQLAWTALYFIAEACRADDPLAQVLRESAYLELACFLVQYPDALLEA